MTSDKDRRIYQAFMDAWDEFGDDVSTLFLIQITADRCKCEYGRVVDALAAITKPDAALKGDGNE